jgi:ComF family protein
MLSLLFPQSCAGCGAHSTPLCDACLSSAPLATEINEKEDVWSAFDYKNELIRKTIWRLKYKGDREIALIYACVLYDKIFEDISDQQLFLGTKKPILVPIPLSPLKKRVRGFNQSEILVQGIAKHDTHHSFKPRFDVLIKTKNTPSQTSIKNRAARIKNIRGCFSVSNPSIVSGAHVILIDDVTTTGATLAEARRMLLLAGASVVSSYTIAH